MADAQGTAKPLNLGPVWREGMVRQGGTRPVGYPYPLEKWVLEAEKKIRPWGLAIDSEWWGNYFNEFGDEVLFQYDGILDYRAPWQVEEYIAGHGRRPPEPMPITLYILSTINLPDWAMLTRSTWLDEHGAFYSWMSSKAMSRAREEAATPEVQHARMMN